jgi:hypothetical protein
MANKEPYAKDVLIVRFASWEHAEVWFGGYEQHMMEANVIAGLNKVKKPKEKKS